MSCVTQYIGVVMLEVMGVLALMNIMAGFGLVLFGVIGLHFREECGPIRAAILFTLMVVSAPAEILMIIVGTKHE
jgi:hypothetical protein